MDDSRVVIEHLPNGKSDDFIIHADSAACRLEDFPIVEYFFDGVAFAQQFFIVILFLMLVIPCLFRCQAFIKYVFCNRHVFPFSDILIAEMIEVILFLTEFLS